MSVSKMAPNIPLLLILFVCFTSYDLQARIISYDGIHPTDTNGRNGLRNPERGFRMEMVGGEIQPWAPYYPDAKIMYLPTAVQSTLTGSETNDQLWVKGMDYYGDQGITTALSYIYLTDYYNTPVIPQIKLDAIQTTFNYFRNNGYKIIPQFLYEFTSPPPYGPTKAIILGHLDQLLPIIAANSDILAALRVGFVGAYGEWHHSYYHIEDDHQALTEITAKILAALPNDRMVCIRVPKYKRWVLGQPNLTDYTMLGSTDAYNKSNKARIGFSDDGFMASDGGIMNDGYTWPEPPYYAGTGNPEFDMMSIESAYLFVCGEMFVQDYGGVIDGYQAAKRMRIHHYSTFSFFHGNNELELYSNVQNPPPYNINRWKQTNISKQQLVSDKMPVSRGYFEDSSGNPVNRTQFEYIRDHLGYRIELQEADIPENLALEDTLSIQMKVINRGFASIMNPRQAIVSLIGWDGKVYEFLTNANPQWWQPILPGDPTCTPVVHTFSIGSKLPADIKPGLYKVGLWMPDSRESLRLNPRYSIKAANSNISWWTDAQNKYGINIIGELEIHGNDEMLGHWKLDETSGIAASDSSSNRNNAILKGGLSFDADSVQGKSGSALNFNYATRDYISAGTGPSLSGAVDFSAAAWIKTSVSWPVAIVQQRDGGVNGSYRLLLNGDGSVRFVIFGDNATQYDFSTTKKVNDDQWHHIVAVRQGQNGSIYVDGQLAASSAGQIRNLSSSIGVVIGGDTWQNNYYFLGAIDDVRIYSYSLDAGNVSILYDSFNNLPFFTSDPVVLHNAAEGYQYSGSISQSAGDPDEGEILTFAKTSGPSWLTVSDNGDVSGVPNCSGYAGLNTFIVQVTDSKGAKASASMMIEVDNTFTGSEGLEDLAAFAMKWQETDCGLCGGADLTGDGIVNENDLAEFTTNWLFNCP